MNRDTRRNRLILGLLLLVSFTLITIDQRGGDASPLGGLRTAAGNVFGPVEQAVSAVVDPVVGAISAVGDLGSSEKRIKALEQENADLRGQLRSSELDRTRAAELDKLLRTAGAGQYRIVPAQVVAVGPAQGFAWTVTIDAGSLDGVKPDMTVINGDGLVGRVRSVSRTTCTVLLAIDPTSSVGVRLESTLQVGVANGQGDHTPLDLQLYDPQTTVDPGARLVTFGSQGDSPFVPGVPVGQVIKVESTPGALTKTATVKPYVDFTALDLVGVVVAPPRTDPRDAVLPPKPKPTPTATPAPSSTPTAGAGSPRPGATPAAGPTPSPSGSGAG
ncbi:MAG: rod shape-determining protein MreC [Motilibacteraceae bacterium]